MLEVQDLRVAYGKKLAVDGVSLTVGEGELAALVGHNGAGKTTVMRAVLGLTPRSGGTVRFAGRTLGPDDAETAVGHGLAFVPQGRNTFRTMTVAENLDVARGAGSGPIGLPEVLAMFPILAERRRQRAGSLSGGQQQMLALAMTLLRNPRLIMLDEPSTGLAPVLVEGVFRTVRDLRERYGVSVLVIDQNVRRLLDLVDRVHVMKAGRLIHAGSPATLAGDDALWQLF